MFAERIKKHIETTGSYIERFEDIF